MTTRNDFWRQFRTDHTLTARPGWSGCVAKTVGVKPKADLRSGTDPADPEAGFGAKQGKCSISVDSRISSALWEK